jgi:tetratricopeptide (TPR) repeat protein
VLDFGQTSRERPIPVIAAWLLGMSPGADDAMRRDAVARAVERGDLPVADVALAHDLLNVEPEADRPSPLATLDSPSRERGRQRVLHRLLECAASSSPRLLVVEDVHWADALEVAQLADLAAATANLPVLLAASTRADGDPISAAWRARARGCPVTTLDLAPFADDEAREYAARYAGLPPAVVERCLETSGGNPLFLQQLLRAAQLGQADLPGTVRGLLLARIERLDLATQRALHAAAVLGSRFPLEALRHVLGEPAFDVAALERSGMLTCGVHHDCQYAHSLIRDAVYESLLRSVRRGWHQRAAQWYEIRDVGLQADHLAAAGDAAAAAVYLKAAAQERQACRFDQALHHALRARETAVHANELCDACAALGEVYLARGRTDDAIAAFRESIDLAASGGARARAWLGLAASLRIVDRYDEALAALDHAEQGAAADADPRVLAQLWTLRGNLHFPRGELDACMAAHERAREFAERAGSLDGIARALGGLGDAHYQRGKMRSARRLFAECVALCEQHALGGLRLAYLPMVAVTAAYMGELAEADRIALAAARSSGDLGDPRSELLSTSIRANIALFGGRYADALAASARSGALAREIGAKRFEAEALILEGLALRGLGRLDEGYGLLERSAAVSREVCPTYCGPWAFAALALATTDANRARALIDEGERLLERGCVSHNHLDFRPAAIEVSLRDGDARAALHHADALERYTSEEPLAPASMYVERGRLLVALRSGTPVPALIDRINNTLQQFDSMGFVAASAGLRAAVDAAT